VGDLPFSFREFLNFEGLDAAGPLSTRRGLLVRKAFERYWERSGFPEVAGMDRALRIRIHQEYWGAMLFRDLVERHDVAHPRAASDLALNRAMAELGAHTGTIVTRDEEESMQVDAGSIDVVAAWRFSSTSARRTEWGAE